MEASVVRALRWHGRRGRRRGAARPVEAQDQRPACLATRSPQRVRAAKKARTRPESYHRSLAGSRSRTVAVHEQRLSASPERPSGGVPWGSPTLGGRAPCAPPALHGYIDGPRRELRACVPSKEGVWRTLVSRADIQRATTRVEARLGSPDGYQTFDTGTNRHIGPRDDGPPARRTGSNGGGAGRIRFEFLPDGSCEATIASA